ncbi:pilus assembly protein TadG-related protein [Streptomyces sp. NPDC005438]|uniref:pilus assembly protein TadG-related protein n=1 Tax=Streptomyces sp. NPDC005438 TaxID=3156880 RepID=UPI0033B74809
MSEKGQAAPLYVTAVVGLLLLALMFFAFGQADASRNGTQSAADSAALAAAQESRDQLKGGFLENLLDGDYLRDLFNGDLIGTYDGCQEASRFAKSNGAESVSCQQVGDGRWGFTVDVKSKKSMGKSILPGTDKEHAKATATALVEPKCSFKPDEDEDGPADDDKPGDDDEKPAPGKLQCDDRDWVLDPDDGDLLPDMADLFRVRLAEN